MSEKDLYGILTTLKRVLVIWSIIGLALISYLGYTFYKEKQLASQFTYPPLRGHNVTKSFTDLNLGDGSGEIHFHCPTSEFYIHIGNSTIVLREINGTIYVEGLKILGP